MYTFAAINFKQEASDMHALRQCYYNTILIDLVIDWSKGLRCH